MKVVAFLVFFISSTIIFSQTQKVFKGEYSNEMGKPGNAEFDYYEKDGVIVKNGTFKYTFNINNDFGKYTALITGNYLNGNKDGVWRYDINYVDFNLNKSSTYATGFYKLQSSYKNGKPNGTWDYSSSNKTRNKNYNGWGTYDKPEISSAKVNFLDGVLVGDIKLNNIENNTYPYIDGQFDNKGFAIGKWVLKRGMSDIEINLKKFYKNALIYDISSSLSSGEVLYKSNLDTKDTVLVKKYFDNLVSYQDLVEQNINLDTINIIETQFLNLNTSFYNKHFLPEYIAGDLCYNLSNYKFENEGAKMILVDKIIVSQFNFNDTEISSKIYYLTVNKDAKSSDFENAIKELSAILVNTRSLKLNDKKIINDKITFCDSLRNILVQQELIVQTSADYILKKDLNSTSIAELYKMMDSVKLFVKTYKGSNKNSSVSYEVENKLPIIYRTIEEKKNQYRANELLYFNKLETKNQTKEKLLSDLNRLDVFLQMFPFNDFQRVWNEQEKLIVNDAKKSIEKALKKLD